MSAPVGRSVLSAHFWEQKILLPVIHVRDAKQAARNVGVARDEGAQGAFLIGHGMPHAELRKVYRSVRRQYRHFWMGLNFLDLPPTEAFGQVPRDCDGIWLDNARIQGSGPEDAARHLGQLHQRHAAHALYFGGVAFKHQRPVDDLARATKTAADVMDVVTTSGAATGQPAEADKVARMRRSLGADGVLALASGVTPQNVETYRDAVDIFLVATGISTDFHTLDPARVRALADRLGR